MKKIVIFLVLSLLVLVFFACDFKIPTAVEIKGSPSVRFAEIVDIGNMFTDLIYKAINGDEEEGTEGDEDMEIFPCTNPELPYITFVVHMDHFDKKLTIDDAGDVETEFPGIDMELIDELVNNDSYTLLTDKYLLNSGKPMILPLSSIGSYLSGFSFKDLITKLYFSGAEVIENFRIEVGIIETDEDDPANVTTPAVYQYELPPGIENKKSDYDEWKQNDCYTGLTPPEGGAEIENFQFSGKNIAVFFRIVVPQGTVLTKDDLDDGQIKVEIVVWLPFVFEAYTDNAEMVFPQDLLFSSKEDLFGRESPNAENMLTDIIESLSLKIVLNKDAFRDADLVIYSKKPDDSVSIEIHNPITDKSLPFIVSKENMDKINLAENWPFTPNFKLVFPKAGDILEFPKEFNTTDIIFEAKIKYRIDF